MKLTELLKQKEYICELLNGPCKPSMDTQSWRSINCDHIDAELSEKVTEEFLKRQPENTPYLTYVLVERDPDTLHEGSCIDDMKKRMRYFVITVIPDTKYPFDWFIPMLNSLWCAELACWELSRAVLAAAGQGMNVKITDEPVPPYLNYAYIESVCLYVGRQPFKGSTKLLTPLKEEEEQEEREDDIRLYKVRELPDMPVLQKLIDAYDSDFPEK